jgi:hypothetical protein
MTEEPGFLARWSRRKRGLERDPTEPPLVAQAPDPAPEAPPFDPASLPPVDGLTLASDISAFLRAEVPAALRNAALRRIWSLDPGIRDFVGPADYAWNFNAPDGVPGFAGSLAGEVKELLAQAIGLTEPEDRPAPRDEAEAPPPELLAEAPPPAEGGGGGQSPAAAAAAAPAGQAAGKRGKGGAKAE